MRTIPVLKSAEVTDILDRLGLSETRQRGGIINSSNILIVIENVFYGRFVKSVISFLTQIELFSTIARKIGLTVVFM